jgi:hypothetical protein
VFLGIIALVSVLEVAGLLALIGSAVQLSRKIGRLIESVEHDQIAPAGARIHAILDDVKTATATIKTNAGWIDFFVGRFFGRG